MQQVCLFETGACCSWVIIRELYGNCDTCAAAEEEL